MARVSNDQSLEIEQMQRQNSYIEFVDQPNIVITGVKFEPVGGSQSILSHHIYFENFGKRTAYKIKIAVFFFRKKADSLQFFGLQSTESKFKGEDNPLQGGGKNEFRIDSVSFDATDFLNSYELILLSYYDEKAKKTIHAKMPFKNDQSLGTLMLIAKQERLLIDDAVKRNHIHL